MILKDELKKILKGDVLNDEKTLLKYSTDWSLLEVKPKAVVFPKDIEDLSALVNFVNEYEDEKLSLTARSAGTDMSGGPINESIIVDFMKYFNHIGEITDKHGIAQPGVFYRDFENATLKRDRIFPSYPASKRLAAIGGIVNNNAGGEKSLIYGKTEKWVREMKMVLRDGKEYSFSPIDMEGLSKKKKMHGLEGQIYKGMHGLIEDNYDAIMSAKPKVSKNSTGYSLWNVYDKEKGTFDLTQVLCGAQGTLGLMTETTLGLIEPKKHSALLAIFIDDLSKLGKIVNRILEHDPETFESYDDKTFGIAVKFLPAMVKTMGVGNLISLGWRFLPEFWMAVTGGIPKLVAVAEFTGNSEEEIYAKANKARDDIQEFDVKSRVAKDDREEEKYWTIRRESFKLLTDHSEGKRTAPFIDDITVDPSKLAEFFPKLQAIMSQYDLTFTIAGHIGDGNFHLIPLIKIGDPEMKKTVPELEEKVFNLVFEYGGSMSGEHNDGLIRSMYLKKMYGQKVYDLFKQTKEIWDPNNIFNPRKKITLEEGFAFRHIDLNPNKEF